MKRLDNKRVDVNISSQKNREFKVLKNIITDDIKKGCRIFSLDRTKLMNSFSYDYSVFKIQLFSEIMNNVKIKGNNQNKNDLEKFLTVIDNAYSFYNCKQFVIDKASIDNISNIEVDKINFDICGDMFIDISYGKEYLPLTIKMLKSDYQIIDSRENHYDNYKVSLLFSFENKVQCFYSIDFIPQLYPRLLVSEHENLKTCETCRNKNIRTFSMCDNTDSALNTSIDLCLVNKRKAENGNCDLCNIKEKVLFINDTESLKINAYDIINIISYVCMMYQKRGTITRKNSPVRKQYEQAKIHVPTNIEDNEKEEKVLELSFYAKHENKKKHYQGGHHSSPREHERRTHLRNYYDENGNIIKTIQVKQSIVNKGKENIVYKVK